MSLFQNIIIIVLLIIAAGFLSLTEIALAGARKVKLKILAEAGEERAQQVLDLQEQSADFCSFSNWPKCSCNFRRYFGEAAFRPFLSL